ncbi:hypothetical protein GGX14DRAFT_636563 [Mycena pura]|uniref:Uncharacterized protein n=1 Tax=Mycena pura TaxID=153505 RepID=A0AAD6VCA6_9AGAR|nr:hypothetical protein GGX14DRAFT_636563 [Mycena pura]
MLLPTILDFAQHLPGVFSPRARKPRSGCRAYKPLPLVSRVQKYRRQEQVGGVQAHPSDLSSCASDRSSSTDSTSTTATAELALPPPAPASRFEPQPQPGEEIDALSTAFFRVELTKMRLRAHCHRPLAPAQDLFGHPHVRRRLEQQSTRDAACFSTFGIARAIHLKAGVGAAAPGCASPAPAPPVLAAPAPCLPRTRSRSSAAVQAWRARQRAAETEQADRAAYARARKHERSPAHARWHAYKKRWVAALDPLAAPLTFTDVPWPVAHVPHSGADITPVEVHRFVLCAEALEGVPRAAVQWLRAEIARWRAERVAAQVLPRVVEDQREAVARAAEHVLDILLAALEDIVEYRGSEWARPAR